MSGRTPTGSCPHPADRLHAGTTYDPGTNRYGIWVACCDCGRLLKDGLSAKTYRLLAAQERAQ